MNIFAVVVAWALTIFLAGVFLKAGRFKLTAPIDTLVGAGNYNCEDVHFWSFLNRSYCLNRD